MNPSRRQGLGLWLLFYQIFGVIGLNNIPPTTLLVTAVNVLIFVRVIPVPWYNSADVCISVDSVWHRKQWLRLIYGAFEHGNDFHLYYNMISFIWKGMSLERRFGSPRFAYLISVFTALCSITLVGLCQLASEFSDRSYYHQCAVGFSSVIFALKVLTTHYWPHGSRNLMGVPFDIPVRYLVWVELLLIQVLVPNASFLGHLAGILVGLAYVHSPLGFVIDSVWHTINAVLFNAPEQTRRFYSSNSVGGDSHRQWNYVPEGMTEEEQFEFARQESLRAQYNNPYNSGFQRAPQHSYPSHGSSYAHPSAPYPDGNRDTRSNLPYPENDYISPRSPNLYPDLDAMRQQRLNRFS